VSAHALMCIPNISEGIDRNTVEQIVAEIHAVKILNVSPDADHNRTVLSYLGKPEAVLAATQAMAIKAFELIDMTRHKGSHPRLGAVDVVPFVPVRGVKMAEAVDIARQFGRFVGDMGIPVYYYEEAATRPDRVSLPDIRRGEYEGLAAKLEDAHWQPDEGPSIFNPKSGGLITGARYPLVAFNVNLSTADLELATQIAQSVRYRNGGYRFVRAMGVELKDQGIVQVSMNMVNYTRTPLPRVLETIRAEAARYGVNVVGTELIGAVPLGVLEQALRYYLQTHDFQTEQIVEMALIE
jgi:glutamate formiminotransferase